ncbi:MAG: hypothetical protein EA382_08015 [Spirochaetaceae bacterium]|nr:MAG: hypothetical protein EA382_08015 [Spirochaetaceae bacterium]
MSVEGASSAPPPGPRAPRLTPGQHYHLFVRRVDSDSAEGVVAGRVVRLPAGDLEPGRWYVARADRGARGVRLVVLGGASADATAAAFLRDAGPIASEGRTAIGLTVGPSPQTGDAGIEQLILSFLRSGMPVGDADLTRAMRRVAAESRLGLTERARLAALLVDKGLIDGDAVWDAAVEALSGRGSRDEGRAGDERGRDRSGASNRGDGSGDGSDDGSDDGSTRFDLDARALAQSIRGFVETPDEAGHPIHLFNHIAGRDHWIVVPIALSGSPPDAAAATYPRLRGSLRIRMTESRRSTTPRSFGFEEAVIVLDCDDRRWSIGLYRDRDALSATVLDAPVDDAQLDDLSQRLARCGVRFRGRPAKNERPDGFSTRPGPSIIRRVDDLA